MKKYLFVILALITINTFSQEAQEVPEKIVDIVLGIDHIEKLDFAPSTKVQIGNESILNYQLIPQKREITFKGRKPGKTSLTIRNTVGDIKAKYLINITANDQSTVVQKLKDFLGDVEGLEIGVKGDLVYIGGNIVVPNDIGRVVTILEKYPDVLSLVELSPQTQRVIAKKMQEEIQKSAMRDVTVRVVNGAYWLEGIVTNANDKVRAEQIAVAYIPDRIESLARRKDAVQTSSQKAIINNFIVVNEKSQPQPPPKLIKITAQFVELTKSYNKLFGFKWTPTLSDGGGSVSFGKTTDGGVTTKSDGTLTGTISNLFPKLSSAKAAGYARVIQSGIIVTKNQTRGTLKKSSTKTFGVGTQEFTRAESVEAGFNLNVTPTILAGESIDLALGISVSSTQGNPPEKFANDISTSVVVKSKESAVVGGVVVSSSTTSYDKDSPNGVDQVENGTGFLSFIRSKGYTTAKSQFVVFVTPEIIQSASQGTEEIQRKFRRRTR
ncbi:bacterial type II and III secretion system protein [Bacteriovorax sp. BSW11_IV]|uniref:pilus assembly protein N-terminal domain-containing protein n=1 Tax=Bacteriovorax sp. BSW11_IV TaxID=1353529 RepID=UPI00038A0F49|nr:pilus assembly protein N-terminal domain-containing protein [Bacteriovorax sp. BSW11_IV]EQC47078.1 bacterial type II and III secretion system protein [Bacteriovorax sp. BSW11_IV]